MKDEKYGECSKWILRLNDSTLVYDYSLTQCVFQWSNEKMLEKSWNESFLKS